MGTQPGTCSSLRNSGSKQTKRNSGASRISMQSIKTLVQRFLHSLGNYPEPPSLPEPTDVSARVRAFVHQYYWAKESLGSMMSRREDTPAHKWKLLLDHLTPQDKFDFEHTGVIITDGSRGGTYALTVCHAPTKVFENRMEQSYCFVNHQHLPWYDVLLAHYLLVRTNEWVFDQTGHAGRVWP